MDKLKVKIVEYRYAAKDPIDFYLLKKRKSSYFEIVGAEHIKHISNSKKLFGEIGWGKLQIENLIVHPEYRKSGIGRALLNEAEDIARQSNCTGVYLDTMSFQALDFYKQQGYDIVGSIDGFENDSTKYFLHKKI